MQRRAIVLAIVMMVATLPTYGNEYKVAVLQFMETSDSLWWYIQREIDVLDDLGLVHDLVRPQDLTTATLSAYARIVLPTMWAHYSWQTTARNEAIRAFLEGGGGLIAGEAGWYGSHSPTFFPHPITINAGWGIHGTPTIPEPAHWLMAGVVESDLVGYTDSVITSKDLAWTTLVRVGAYDSIVYSEYGEGFAIYAGKSAGDPDDQWFRNAVVPEPATIGLLVVGGLALLRRRATQDKRSFGGDQCK